MKIISNTPLREPPADYCPKGSDQWYTIKSGLDCGKTIFYSDIKVGEKEPECTVLFVHGNPENSYTYRKVRDTLIESNTSLRLVLVDHIGFGLSDQADFEMVEMHHAANLLELVRHLDLQRVILVVHDWGGPIGIGALLEDSERVAGLCVLNTSVFPMPTDGDTWTNYPHPLLPWHLTPKLIPDKLWGAIAATLLPSKFNPKQLRVFLPATIRSLWRVGLGKITAADHEYVWSEPFTSKGNTRSSKQLVRQTALWGTGLAYTDKRHGIQDNKPYYKTIQENISKLWGPEGKNIPACAHFGVWDAFTKESVFTQWRDALPQLVSNIHLYEDAGHFIEEHKGVEIAHSIIEMTSVNRAKSRITMKISGEYL